MEGVKFEDLIGKTIVKIENKDNQELIFTASNGDEYYMYHDQDCCENVRVEDITGDLDDLLNSEILKASKDTNRDLPSKYEYGDESYTWTFYNIATIKGYVTIRWYGSSNGYYGEGVSFYVKLKEEIV